eukprot:2174070-Rhodomonas_salina.5
MEGEHAARLHAPLRLRIRLPPARSRAQVQVDVVAVGPRRCCSRPRAQARPQAGVRRALIPLSAPLPGAPPPPRIGPLHVQHRALSRGVHRRSHCDAGAVMRPLFVARSLQQRVMMMRLLSLSLSASESVSVTISVQVGSPRRCRAPAKVCSCHWPPGRCKVLLGGVAKAPRRKLNTDVRAHGLEVCWREAALKVALRHCHLLLERCHVISAIARDANKSIVRQRLGPLGISLRVTVLGLGS